MGLGCQQFNDDGNDSAGATLTHPATYDHHVHILSPALIDYWKSLGIPFSKPDAAYADIDTILRRNGADTVDLISMAYVWRNEDYYPKPDGADRMRAENDFVLRSAARHPGRILPFIAVDPLRSDAFAEIERIQAHPGPFGLKLHFNTSQVYLTEPVHRNKVRAVLERTSGHPVLLHFDNLHPKFGAPDLRLLVDSVLVKLPPIDLRIAHLGTSGGFNAKTRAFLDEFLRLRNAGLLPNQHRIRLDVSAVLLDKDSEGVAKLTSEERRMALAYLDQIGRASLLFGTDYPLYTANEYAKLLNGGWR